MDSSGINVVQITHIISRERPSYPTYSGDCKSVFYIVRSVKTNRIELWRQDIDSSEPVQLTEGGSYRFSVSKSGKIVYMKNDDEKVIGNLWIVDSEGNKKPLFE